MEEAQLVESNKEVELPVAPNAIFDEFIDKFVCVKTEACRIKGMCRSVDGYLNTVLENVEFTSECESMKLNTCFITGSSIKYIKIIES